MHFDTLSYLIHAYQNELSILLQWDSCIPAETLIAWTSIVLVIIVSLHDCLFKVHLDIVYQWKYRNEKKYPSAVRQLQSCSGPDWVPPVIIR